MYQLNIVNKVKEICGEDPLPTTRGTFLTECPCCATEPGKALEVAVGSEGPHRVRCLRCSWDELKEARVLKPGEVEPLVVSALEEAKNCPSDPEEEKPTEDPEIMLPVTLKGLDVVLNNVVHLLSDRPRDEEPLEPDCVFAETRSLYELARARVLMQQLGKLIDRSTPFVDVAAGELQHPGLLLAPPESKEGKAQLCELFRECSVSLLEAGSEVEGMDRHKFLSELARLAGFRAWSQLGDFLKAWGFACVRNRRFIKGPAKMLVGSDPNAPIACIE